jgi:tRNA(Ile2) C34 agmatinyltransferase TiaS
MVIKKNKPRLSLAAMGRTRNYQPKKRLCLACDRLFKSEGPHNRICPECKYQVMVLGYAPNRGGI